MSEVLCCSVSEASKIINNQVCLKSLPEKMHAFMTPCCCERVAQSSTETMQGGEENWLQHFCRIIEDRCHCRSYKMMHIVHLCLVGTLRFVGTEAQQWFTVKRIK